MLLLGWKLSQWAAAAAYWKRFAPLPSKDFKGALAVYHKWRAAWPYEPGEPLLIGVSDEREWGWAADTMHRVFVEMERGRLLPRMGAGDA